MSEENIKKTKEVPCPDCYGGHFKPCNICGDSGVALLVIEEKPKSKDAKLEGERKHYMEHLQLNEELVSEIERENERLKEQNKRQNEAIDSLREMYAKEAKP